MPLVNYSEPKHCADGIKDKIKFNLMVIPQENLAENYAFFIIMIVIMTSDLSEQAFKLVLSLVFKDGKLCYLIF